MRAHVAFHCLHCGTPQACVARADKHIVTCTSCGAETLIELRVSAVSDRRVRLRDDVLDRHPLVAAVMEAEAEGRFRQETTGQKAS